MSGQNGDMGISKLGIACIAYRKRGIKVIVNGSVKVFEKTDGWVVVMRVGGPCEIGNRIVGGNLEEMMTLEKRG